MRLLLIDNHDSFTAILHHYLWELAGEKPLLYRNDELTRDDLERLDFEVVVLSPGPGHPALVRDFGVCGDVLELFPRTPVLGVCLGLQGLAHAAGGRVIPMPGALHGRPSRIAHDGTGLFRGLPEFTAIRYHSLVVDPNSLPATARVTARAAEDGVIMGLSFTDRPWHGVQFHPESFGTEHGKALLANFLDLAKPRRVRPPVPPVTARIANRFGTSGSAPPPPKKNSRTVSHVALAWREPADVFVTYFHDVTNSFWLDGSAWEATAMGRAEDAQAFAGWNAWRAWADALDLGEERSAPWDGYRGGPVGHLSYEGYRATLAAAGPGGGGASAAEPSRWLLPEGWLAFDRAARTVYAAWENQEPPRWLAEIITAWDRPSAPRPEAALPPFEEWTPAWSEAEYVARVETLQDAIARGETYEACLTHSFSATADAGGRSGAEPVDALAVFLRLRARNPAPYAAFLAFADVNILSASPELFLEARGGIVRSLPIKGTRRRGRDAASDSSLRDELAASVKDAAENRMIVDLTRHDLARVCEPGSVEVPVFLRVEEHPAVFQLVSEVRGRLTAAAGATDAITACFPGGSMTGAPKERTVEILSRLEAAPRGIYSGALGYLTGGGAFRLSMVIRTLENRGPAWRAGCGGAVLADSDPAAEWREATLKARSVIDAAGL